MVSNTPGPSRRSRRARLLLAIALAMAPVTVAVAASPAKPSVVPVDARVPVPPTAIRSGDAWHFLYELRLSNFSGRPMPLEHVEVLGEDGTPFASFAESKLATMLAIPAQAAATEATTLAPGTVGTLFLEVVVPATGAPPAHLSHRLRFTSPAATDPSRTTIEGPRVAVGPAQGAVVLGPPLGGGNWLAANGLSNESDHRRTLVTVDGQARIAQRYAVDFVQLDDEGRAFSGDASMNANWVGYRAPVLAVADGQVTAVRGDLPDNTPGQLPATKISLDTIGGNTVALDIGDGRHVLYGHLVPGSIRVAPGQKVHKGDVIGELGNSGQSDAPHLHLQVADAGSALAAEGLPYVFACFRDRGRVTSVDAALEAPGAWKPVQDGAIRSKALPGANEVFSFCD